MQARSRKVAVFVGAAALAAGVGVGVASQGGDSAASARGGSLSQRAGGPGQGGPGGMDLSALAGELGVTEARLEAAMQAVRQTAAPGAGGPDAMAAALAEELGLAESKVADALESFRPDGGAPPDGSGGMTPPSDGTAPGGTTPPSDGTAPSAGSAGAVQS